MIGAQLVGVERRLKAAVLSMANGGWVTHNTTAEKLNGLATSLTCAARDAWFQAMTPIEPIRYIGNSAPAELSFQIARLDTTVPLADAMALYNAASNPKEVIFYDAAHNLNAQALPDRHNWLHNKLGIEPLGAL
jgi:uncharacterized protein